jgi:hypothetical protein
VTSITGEECEDGSVCYVNNHIQGDPQAKREANTGKSKANAWKSHMWVDVICVSMVPECEEWL